MAENGNNIAVLASTNATDLEGVIQAIKDGKLDVNIKILIANKECGAVEKAKKHNIPYIIIPSKGKEREDFDKEVAKVIDENDVKLVLMIGYMRIVTPWFVNKYENKMMNIHPSLLPAFGGGMDKNVHQDVLDYGCKVTGCTLHFVTEEADEGPIIVQKAVKIEEDDTVDSLKEKVQASEMESFVEAIDLFFKGKIKVEGRVVRIEQ
ncbi:phosphoribosylglycinamide formyltransferase [Nanoarchaeota archaeon]